MIRRARPAGREPCTRLPPALLASPDRRLGGEGHDTRRKADLANRGGRRVRLSIVRSGAAAGPTAAGSISACAGAAGQSAADARGARRGARARACERDDALRDSRVGYAAVARRRAERRRVRVATERPGAFDRSAAARAPERATRGGQPRSAPPIPRPATPATLGARRSPRRTRRATRCSGRARMAALRDPE